MLTSLAAAGRVRVSAVTISRSSALLPASGRIPLLASVPSPPATRQVGRQPRLHGRPVHRRRAPDDEVRPSAVIESAAGTAELGMAAEHRDRSTRHWRPAHRPAPWRPRPHHAPRPHPEADRSRPHRRQIVDVDQHPAPTGPFRLTLHQRRHDRVAGSHQVASRHRSAIVAEEAGACRAFRAANLPSGCLVSAASRAIRPIGQRIRTWGWPPTDAEPERRPSKAGKESFVRGCTSASKRSAPRLQPAHTRRVPVRRRRPLQHPDRRANQAPRPAARPSTTRCPARSPEPGALRRSPARPDREPRVRPSADRRRRRRGRLRRRVLAQQRKQRAAAAGSRRARVPRATPISQRRPHPPASSGSALSTGAAGVWPAVEDHATFTAERRPLRESRDSPDAQPDRPNPPRRRRTGPIPRCAATAAQADRARVVGDAAVVRGIAAAVEHRQVDPVEFAPVTDRPDHGGDAGLRGPEPAADQPAAPTSAPVAPPRERRFPGRRCAGRWCP